MCYIVEAEYLLIHTLKGKAYCTISELVENKNKIESNSPDIFIDVSRSAIECSLSRFPNIFQFDEDRILKVNGSDKYFEEPLIKYFDSKVNEPCRDAILKFL